MATFANNQRDWEIKYEDLSYNEAEENFIGEGGYGKVYRGEWRGGPVAIKKLHVRQLTRRAQNDYVREIELLWGLQHSALVKLYGAVMNQGFYAMVMELMEGGSLYYMLHDDDIELSWLRKCKILHAISAGVEYLHSQNIIHRDLKSLNVLLDKQLNPKLCDFGLAVVRIETESQAPSSRRSNMASAIGTIRWLAPEVMQGRSHSKHSDVWALGLIVSEVVTRKVPFHSISTEAALVANLSNATASNFQLDLPVDCPSSLQEIIHSCLLRDPLIRPGAGNVSGLLKNAYDQQVRIRIQNREEQQGPSSQEGAEESNILRNNADSSGAVVAGDGVVADETVPTPPTIAAATATVIPLLQNLNLNPSEPSVSAESIAIDITNKLREVEALKEELTKELERGRKERAEFEALRIREREEEARRREETRLQEEAARRRELEENNRRQLLEARQREETRRQEDEARRRELEETNRRQMEGIFAIPQVHDPALFTQHSYVQRTSISAGSHYGGTSTGQRHVSSGSANGRELFTGPRGGTYYINSNGNKTYVSRR